MKIRKTYFILFLLSDFVRLVMCIRELKVDSQSPVSDGPFLYFDQKWGRAEHSQIVWRDFGISHVRVGLISGISEIWPRDCSAGRRGCMFGFYFRSWGALLFPISF